MIRCIRLWTGDDDNSPERGDILSGKIGVVSISVRDALGLRAGKFAGLEQCGDRPCRQLRAELHAAA